MVLNDSLNVTEPIYVASRECSDIFENYVDSLPGASQAHETLLELRSLFRQWTAYVGAFAVPKASLDARLQNHGAVREIILDLLFMLQQNLQWARRTGSQDTADELVYQHTESNKPCQIATIDEVGLPVVQTTIGRLLQIGVAIRHSGWYTHQSKLKDEDPASMSLREQWLGKKYRNMPQSLKSQLSRSMYTRTTSMDYMRSHNERLAHERKEVASRNHAASSDPSNLEEPVGKVPRNNRLQAPNGLLAPTIDTSHSVMTPSAVARVQSVMRKPTSTVISRGVPVFDTTTDEFLYPDIPEALTACPICACPLQFSSMRPHEWRTHVEGDLEPYVCISEECLEPLCYFKTLKEWEHHMQSRHTIHWAEKIHTERWYCDLGHETIKEFDRQDGLEAHLTAEHWKHLTASKLRGRLRRNKRIATRDPLVCPICDCKPEDVSVAVDHDPVRLLWAHIGGHLKSLAFLSLPHDHFAAGEPQSLPDSTSNKGDKLSGSPYDDLEPRDTNFDQVPETVVSEDGTCKFHEWIGSSCESRDDTCCRLRTEDQGCIFRAEPDLDEEALVGVLAGWTTTCLRMSILDTELLKSRLKSNFHHPPREYFPEGCVKNLVTEEAVLHEFRKVENWESLVDPGDFGEVETLIEDTRLSRESLAPWVAEDAPKTFAAAIISGFTPMDLSLFIVTFIRRGWSDADQPCGDIPSIFRQLGLSHKTRSTFSDNLLSFLVPVFSAEQFEYVLYGKSILPFVEQSLISQGVYETLWRVRIHRDHYKPSSTESVAIREFDIGNSPSTSEVSALWQANTSVIQRVNNLDHNHLIRCLAAIKMGDRRYLMFPWAHAGNLKDYWNTCVYIGPNARLIKDAVRQLRGLADALRCLHTPIQAPTIVHGNVKPENIFRFSDKYVGTKDLSINLGILRLGRLGFTKRFANRMGNRPSHSAIQKDASSRYGLHLKATRIVGKQSLTQDTWSIVCIALEFIIWILYGRNGLAQFNTELGDTFWEMQERKVHPVVTAWISHILEKDPECSQPSVIRDLLRIVRDQFHFLAPAPPDNMGSGYWHRATPVDLVASIDKILDNIEDHSKTYLFTEKNRDSVRLPPRESIVTAESVYQHQRHQHAVLRRN